MILAKVPFDSALTPTALATINGLLDSAPWHPNTVELLKIFSTTSPYNFANLCRSEGVLIEFDVLAKMMYVKIDTTKKTFITLNQLHKFVPFVVDRVNDYVVTDTEIKNDTGFTFTNQARWEFKRCKLVCNGSNLEFRDGCIIDFEQCTIVGGSLLTNRIGSLGGQGLFRKCSFESSTTHNNKLLRLSLGMTTTKNVSGSLPAHLEQKLEFDACDFGKTSIRIQTTNDCRCEFHGCSFIPFDVSPTHPRFIDRYDDVGEVLFVDCKFPAMQAFPSHSDGADKAMAITAQLKKLGVVRNMTPDKFVLDTPKITDLPAINVIRQSVLMSTDMTFYMFVEMTPNTITRTLSDTNFDPDDHKFHMDGFDLSVGYGDPIACSLYNLKHWRFGKGLTTVTNAVVNLNAFLQQSTIDIRDNGTVLVPMGCPPYCGTELISDRRFIELVRSNRLEFTPLWESVMPMQCPTVTVRGHNTMDNTHGWKFPALSTKFQPNFNTMEHDGTNWFMHLEMATRISEKEAMKKKPTPLDVMYKRFESFVMLAKMSKKLVSK